MTLREFVIEATGIALALSFAASVGVAIAWFKL
jgi:hypothetical protein